MTNLTRKLTSLSSGLALATAMFFTAPAAQAQSVPCGSILTLNAVSSKSTVVNGEVITYTYTIGNPAAFALYFQALTDDNGTPGNPADDYYQPIGQILPGESLVFTRTAAVSLASGCQTNRVAVDGNIFETGECICTVAYVTICIAPPASACPLTQGYWKNHATKWPVTSLTIGCQTYTQAELLTIFNTPPKGDASIILMHQLIAAMLNDANGAPTGDKIDKLIAAANKCFCDAGRKIPLGIKTSSKTGATMVFLACWLDAYNNGLLTPGCFDCD
jgi:hypothetical protein